MAKAKKKRPSAKATTETEGIVYGTVTIPVYVSVTATGPATYDELVIEWECLGLSVEPDKIGENSGNARLLDPEREPEIDADGLHVYFKPALPGGNYGFQFTFTYNEAVEVRTAKPLTPEEKAKKEKEKHEPETSAREAA